MFWFVRLIGRLFFIRRTRMFWFVRLIVFVINSIINSILRFFDVCHRFVDFIFGGVDFLGHSGEFTLNVIDCIFHLLFLLLHGRHGCGDVASDRCLPSPCLDRASNYALRGLGVSTDARRACVRFLRALHRFSFVAVRTRFKRRAR